MIRSEIEASNAVKKMNITDPVLRNQLYKHLLHASKLKYDEYPRLPRKLKKRLQKEEDRADYLLCQEAESDELIAWDDIKRES